MDKNQLTKLEKYWILYDIGNSAFVLLVSTIIPIYFKNIASANGISLSDSTAYYGYAVSLSTLIVAVIGPVLGTIADTKGYKKPLFTFSMMVGVIGCLCSCSAVLLDLLSGCFRSCQSWICFQSHFLRCDVIRCHY